MRQALSFLLCLVFLVPAVDAHPMGAPPGQRVDIGGRRLHLNCLGHGAPTVLIDIGLGPASLEWDGVMRRVALGQQACVFERAGYGWSEMGPYPRTSSRHENWRPRRTIARELLGFRASEAELREAPPLLPMPLVVLTRGKRVWPEGAKGDALEKLWLTLQDELAGQSPIAAHLLAPSSGHPLHLEAPALVGAAVTLATPAWRLRAMPSDDLPRQPSPASPQPPEDPFVTLSDTLGLPVSPMAALRGTLRR